MTNELTVYLGEQIFFDKRLCLCDGNNSWTAEQQAPEKEKPESLTKQMKNVIHK